METVDHVTQIFNQLPGVLLEKSRLGRSELPLFWLSSEKIEQAARALKEEAGFDFLENLSAMQVDENLVFTYFVRSLASRELVVLRVSVAIPEASKSAGPGAENGWAKHASLAEIWKMAGQFEREIGDLFGVVFSGEKRETAWDGFPLRKEFVVSGGVSP